MSVHCPRSYAPTPRFLRWGYTEKSSFNRSEISDKTPFRGSNTISLRAVPVCHEACGLHGSGHIFAADGPPHSVQWKSLTTHFLVLYPLAPHALSSTAPLLKEHTQRPP